MGFSVGDKILYPNRGAGTIVGREHEELVDGFEDYYVIEIRSQRLILRVPMRMMKELGIRRAVSRRKVPRIWEALRSEPQQLPDDFKERQEQIRERLRTGDFMEIAAAVRDLSFRELQAYLTKADTKLLGQGRELLVDEVALVLDRENAEAEQLLDKALSVHADAAAAAAAS
jgi:CarD family transcriptional regulator